MRRVILFICFVIVSTSIGCTRHVTIETWKEDLQTYIFAQANGDIHAMRSNPADSLESEFAVISAKSPDNSTDIKGLLLGRRIVNEKPWYVFLLGVIKNSQLESIRLALMNEENGRITWFMSEPDVAATNTYESNTPMAYSIFPTDRDIFHISTGDDVVSVTEHHSGAVWSVHITDKRPPEKFFLTEFLSN